MLKLDAPSDSSSQVAVSNQNYPESEAIYGGSGPGWSWMWVPAPFSSMWVQGRFTRQLFKRYQTAHRDLRAFIGENLAGNNQRWSKAAIAALRDVTAQEFVLVCSTVWAFAAFEVRSGRSAEAGTAFYNGWVGAMNADPQAQYAVMASEEPMVMAVS
ncbi:hypothetical protein [Microtetraspora malaysiensis]|uniref:hypothetical protein n=1 Tax=Microtetraspora malaysiensis TaxID=161358 RepID=UPI003D93FDB0